MFSWDAKSAFRKATSDLEVSVPVLPFVSIGKKVTGPHDPKKDAYRGCSQCGKHANYHKNGKCP